MTTVIRLKNQDDWFRTHRGFQWMDKYYVQHYPKDMATHHLFYTLRMIWNHTVPEDMKIKPYKHYRLDPNAYNKEYLITAIRALGEELARRNDTELYMPQLNKMMEFMKNKTEFMEKIK